ncbi:MAG TPA: YhcN/YlaJ family sporulation lipoprotein [Bacillales bacterium]|nr:YhcN/YlaJ family sporulation lipoprotein [Bacillales bacterium]
MKKWVILTLTAVLSSGLTGCSPGNNGLNPNNYQNQTMQLENRTQQGNNRNPRNDQDAAEGHFGFVRLQDGPDGRTPGGTPTLNFEDLADAISRLVVNYPDVHDVATLVTSKEILIGYKTDSENRKLVADQVKRAALSLAPRFYHIYVTDDPSVLRDISRFRDLPPRTDVQEMLNATINEMQTHSPQGKDVSPSENPNGESKNNEMEMNHR